MTKSSSIICERCSEGSNSSSLPLLFFAGDSWGAIEDSIAAGEEETMDTKRGRRNGGNEKTFRVLIILHGTLSALKPTAMKIKDKDNMGLNNDR